MSKQYDTDKIYVLGESHSLFWGGYNGILKEPPLPNSRFIIHHIGPTIAFSLNKYGTAAKGLERAEKALMDINNSYQSKVSKPTVMTCFGETDVRVHAYKGGNDNLISRINNSINSYMAFIDKWSKDFNFIIYGVICSQKDDWSNNPQYPRCGSEVERNVATIIYNDILRKECDKRDIFYYSQTDKLIDNNMRTREEFICADQCHLGNEYYEDEVRRFFIALERYMQNYTGVEMQISTEQKFGVAKCVNEFIQYRPDLIVFNNDANLKNNFRRLLYMLRPYDMIGKNKIRIGGCSDGGYVMLEPDFSDIIYSVGVSCHAPFDWQIANLGFRVYEVDATINKPPYDHNNLIFINKNLAPDNNHGENEITISEMLSLYNHKNHNLILHIDIEGHEWGIFEKITDEDLIQFKQIICEFHNLKLDSDLERFRRIFQKLLNKFVPIHFHYNNNSKLYSFDDFLLSFTYEISFARRDLGSFTPSKASYPTILDFPNNPAIPEIFIGEFDNFA